METQARIVNRNTCAPSGRVQLSSCTCVSVASGLGWVWEGDSSSSGGGQHMAVADVDGLAQPRNGVWSGSELLWVAVDPYMGKAMEDWANDSAERASHDGHRRALGGQWQCRKRRGVPLNPTAQTRWPLLITTALCVRDGLVAGKLRPKHPSFALQRSYLDFISVFISPRLHLTNRSSRPCSPAQAVSAAPCLLLRRLCLSIPIACRACLLFLIR